MMNDYPDARPVMISPMLGGVWRYRGFISGSVRREFQAGTAIPCWAPPGRC
jgi:hypothetical protein